MNEKKYYLLVDGDVFSYESDFEKLVDYIIGFGLHTKFYGKNICTTDVFYQFFDCHEGVHSSYDELRDNENISHDVVIVEEFYVTMYEDYFNIINDWRSKMKMDLLEKEG